MDAKINGAGRNTVEKNGGGKGSSRMKDRESTCFFLAFLFLLRPVGSFWGWVNF